MKKVGSLLRQRARLRYQFIDIEKKAYPISLLCKVMQVSTSGYYTWRNRGKSKRQKENEKLLPLVLETHRFTKGTYGARRMAKEIRSYGFGCGRYRAKTLMSLAGVQAKQKRRFKVTTDSRHNLPTAPNLLKSHNILSSMSRKGDCWDNAVAESFFASLKTERVYLNRYKTRQEATADIFNYIEMFSNSKRRHSFLGNLSPKIMRNYGRSKR